MKDCSYRPLDNIYSILAIKLSSKHGNPFQPNSIKVEKNRTFAILCGVFSASSPNYRIFPAMGYIYPFVVYNLLAIIHLKFVS